MIWKNLKKKLNIRITTDRTVGKNIAKRWEMFGKMMGDMARMAQQMTRTDNRKGKVGKLETVWSGGRRFGEPRWVFRKFEKKTFDNADGFIKGLERRGFKRLGSGAFSTVLGKDGQDKVVKVIQRPDGWINYVHWAAQIGEAGHFAPKVSSYKKIKGRYSDFAVAIMEKLEYDLDNGPKDQDVSLVPTLLWRIENPMARKFMEVLVPGLLDYLTKMAAEWKIKIEQFDLHDGNLMLRKDGSFVVIDPVSRGEDKFNRLKERDFGPLPLCLLVA